MKRIKMSRVKNKTEEKFLSKLKEIENSLKNVRAVHYRLSKFGSLNIEVIDVTLEKYFEDSCIYFFNDGDVIVISNFAPIKIFEAANKELSEKLEIAEINFSSIYELEKSYLILNSIGERKLEKIKAEQEQNNKLSAIQNERAEEQRTSIFLNIDSSLVNNLPKKREARNNPEILIIEDDSFSRKLVCNALKKDFRITQAVDGNDGLNSYFATAPNIVFLDIDMPGMNGHQVLKKIVSNDPESFVVMLSGNGNKENVLEAIKLGAKGFVAKPFTKEKLYEYVNKYKVKRG